MRTPSWRLPLEILALLPRYGWRKTANVLLVEWERHRRRAKLRGKPYHYFVDPCNLCDLRCPLCPTGTSELRRARGMLSLADFRIILDKIAPYAITVSLDNWGEPLLNGEIFEIVRAASERGLFTSLSSHLSLEIGGLGERLVRSGLNHLTVSLDGVTQEVYGRYRVGGDLELVLRNVREIVEAKRRLGSATPFVEWQFIVFPHNEHEMAAARELAPALGVDELRFRSPGLPFERVDDEALGDRWLPENPAFRDLDPAKFRAQGYLWAEPCFYLYRSMSIHPGGGVAGCPMTYDERRDFGNLLDDDLATIWNNRSYQASRALFASGAADPAGTICDGCYLFQREGARRPRPLRLLPARPATAARFIGETSASRPRPAGELPHGREAMEPAAVDFADLVNAGGAVEPRRARG